MKADEPNQFRAIQVRPIEVHEHEVPAAGFFLRLNDSESFGHASSKVNRMPTPFQASGKDLTNDFIVFKEEEAWGHRILQSFC